MRRILIGLAVFACLVAVEADARAAAYIKIEGIEGEVRDKDHAGWIELESVSHAIHKPMTGSGATRRRGDVVLEDITVVKGVDKASPKLAEAVCKGKVFPKVDIYITASYSDAGRTTYYSYELTNVRVTSYSVSASGADAVPVEEVSLNFSKIKVDYGDAAKGKSKGKVETTWKVEEGEK